MRDIYVRDKNLMCLTCSWL